MSATSAPVSTGVSSASAGSTSDNASMASQSSASEAMKSISSVISSASAALQSESQIAAGGFSLPSWMKWLGLALAVGSGFLIGASFVLKKRGLLAAQRKYQTQAGESLAYLKNPLWWGGMTMMILGEILNLVAYAVSSAVLVTPLGALSVVICAILSSIFLKEKLTLFGKIGCFLCIVGSTVIALNGPEQHAAGEIKEFQKLFLSVGFLVWAGICIVASVILAFFVAPKYGKKYMLVHITICSLIGGLSVSTISGIGSAVVLTIQGENQFKHWFLYFLLAFVVITLVTEIIFLNKALELFNTAMVTPTYYVLFTFATLVTSVILFQGLDSTAIQIVTIVLGFLTICAGITLLQLSKIDPDDLTNKEGAVGIDRGTTMLLRASRSHISHKGDGGMATAIEDPGMDTVRGGLGVIGSMVRARSSRKIHASSDAYRQVVEHGLSASDSSSGLNTLGKRDLERYELHDRPVPRRGSSSAAGSTVVGQAGGKASLTPANMPSKRDTTISFASGSEDPHGHHQHSALEKPMEGLGNVMLTSPPSSHGILMSPSQSQTGLAGSRNGSLEPPSVSNPYPYANQRQGQPRFTTEPGSFLTPDAGSNVATSGSTPASSMLLGTDDGRFSSQGRPSGPRLAAGGAAMPRSDAAGDLKRMWDPSGTTTQLRPDESLESLDDTMTSQGNEDDVENQGGTRSRREARQPSRPGERKYRSASKGRRDEDEFEEEELLSPDMRGAQRFAAMTDTNARR